MIKFKIRAPECTRTHHFYVKNSKIFWGGVVPQREGDTPSQTHPPQRLRRLDLHASLTHPTRKSGYGLTGGASNSLVDFIMHEYLHKYFENIKKKLENFFHT